MTGRAAPLARVGFSLALALGVTLAIVAAAGAPPLDTLAVMAVGGLGSGQAVLRTLSALVPLLLCGAALCVTFAANLWNIGVEGQITLGAVFCVWFLRDMGLAGVVPPFLAVPGALAASMVGGMAWALLSGVLRTHGRVHEIFSGLGLNFVAMGVSLWLILGPWKRPGMASMSGTEPLPADLWLPALGGRPMSLWGLVLAVAAFVLVAWVLQRTFFGLTLSAVRQNAMAGRAPGASAQTPDAGGHGPWRGAGRSGRRHPGGRALPSPHSVHFRQLRLHRHHGRAAGFRQPALSAAVLPFFRRPHRGLHPASPGLVP